jgi:hypothetical protein
MSEGQSQRSVASSAQHRQEAEVAVAEERERAAAARVARLAIVELAAARAEVEAAAVADAAHVAAAELEALRASSTGNSVCADDDRDDELKLAREAAWEQAVQWAADGAPGGRGARGGCVPDGGGSPDRRGRAGGWVDGDCSLYRRRGSASPDRYRGHHGI